MIEKLKKNIVYIILIALLFPALFINLGKMPLSSDEPTRAVVAMEMNFSGNYVTPTIHGEYYYRKPPLYNWILAGLFKLTNSQSEFIIRLPAVISLLGIALTILLFVRKRIGFKSGLFSALMFVTCGRVLFYDSQLGLIDLFYSWLTFTNFIVIFYFFYKRKFIPLFILSYIITALGTLTKGFPSIAFQGITLLVFFIHIKEFKKLFHWAHFAGIAVFICIVGGYFYIYSKYNSPLPYLKTLLFESTQRTPIEHAFLTSVKHLLLFPFYQLYHLAPWSLLIILFFKKGLFRSMMKDPFIKFCFIIFLANIIPYWISPATLPRYLFMLYPLAFIILAYTYAKAEEQAFKIKQILITTLNVGVILIILAGIVFFHVLSSRLSMAFNMKIIILILFLSILAYYTIKLKGYRLLLFAAILLALRVGFNWFVIPYRFTISPDTKHMAQAIKVASITQDEKLFTYGGTPLDNFYIYYIERSKNQILHIVAQSQNVKDFYLVSEMLINDDKAIKKYYTFDIIWKNKTLHLVKFKAP